MNYRIALILLAACLTAACGGIDLSEDNPPGLNLSGEWLIDFGDSDGTPDLRSRAGGKTSRRTRRPVTAEALRLGDGSGLAFVVQDFQVLRADRLVVEQNKDSMGIFYDPGVYRDISWGERQRRLWEVTAGWEARELVIISEAKDLRVTERMSMLDSGQLSVVVEVRADGEVTSYTRVFNRRG